MKKTIVPPTPFPTQAEIIRVVANAFDIQVGKKKIDEYVRFGDLQSDQIRERIIDEVIYTSIKKDICLEFAKHIRQFLKEALDNYIRAVLDKGSDYTFVLRKNALPWLAQEIGSMTILVFLSKLPQQEQRLLFLLKDNEPLFASLIDQLQGTEEWNSHYAFLGKEDKDKLLSWKQDKSLPRLQSIKLIFGQNTRFKRLFILARAIEFLRKSEAGQVALETALYEIKGENYTQCPDPRSLVQNISDEWVQKGDYLFEVLFDRKGNKNKEALRKSLNEFSRELFARGYEVYGLFNLHMFEAQWHVLAGENNKALEHYKQALAHGLYRVGKQQTSVIKRALCVASIENNMPLMKQLKRQAIVFGMYNSPFEQDSLDIKTNNKKSRAKSNIVEDWEIIQWQQEFAQLFPQEMFFDGVKTKGRNHPFGMVEGSVNPDYRHVNRMITTHVTGRVKKQPQLGWFISNRNYETVEKLLKNGASVDVVSDSGDTPLLLSVIQMSKDKQDFVDEPDDSFFKLISSHKHKPETVNRRTSKKRITPLMSAIDTGRLDVVQKLLEMGADVDRKASADDITPLYYCITLINRLQNPNKYNAQMINEVNNSVIQNEIRRFVPPDLMMSVDTSSPLLKSIQDLLVESGWAIPDIDPQAVEKMACLLLEYGANPNCKHSVRTSGISLYTPLMLAAEFDNLSLFQHLVEKGGDLKIKAKYATSIADGSLEGICKWFGSDQVLDYLDRCATR